MEDSMRRRLLARGVVATDDWLNTCANDFRSSNEYNSGQDRLEEHIFKQWLQVNLGNFRVSSFPPDLENQLKVTLNGQYTCQIVSVIDTGHSAYSQYQKVRNVDTTNLTLDDDKDKFQKKWEPKSSRTLLMSITDGVQELVALEAQRIPVLSINLKPGCKALLKGPITCRRGFIMLEKVEQITLLGGEVESFLIPNAFENILALSLGLPINENPQIATGTGDAALLNEEGDEQQERRNTNPRAETNKPLNAPFPAQRPVARALVQPVQWNRPDDHLLDNDFLDDNVLLSIDLDNIISAQQEITPNTDTASTRSGTTSDWTSKSAHSAKQSQTTANSTRKPDAPRSTLNPQPPKQPSPDYTIDIDEELLNEFSNDLDEAAFSLQMPCPPPRNPTSSKRPISKEQEISVPPSKIVNLGKPKGTSATTKQSRAISDWFKPDKTVVSINSSMSSLSSSEVSSGEQSSRIVANSGRPGNSVQARMAPESQDSGFPTDDDDDIIMLAEGNFFSRNAQTENERLQTDGPLKIADIVKNIVEGVYSQVAKVKTKVRVNRVVESIGLRNDEWKMAVEINDGSAVMLVSVSSETVTKIFGISPAEGARKRRVALTDPAVRENLRKAFHRFETTLKSLDCIFELLIHPGRRPCVVNIVV